MKTITLDVHTFERIIESTHRDIDNAINKCIETAEATQENGVHINFDIMRNDIKRIVNYRLISLKENMEKER